MIGNALVAASAIFVAFAFWPGLVLVIWGELAPNTGDEIEAPDKLLHFIGYFGLALMPTIAVRADQRALWWALARIRRGGGLGVIASR